MLCGAALDVPTNREPAVVIKAASGSPNLRTIMLDGVEIHACAVPDSRGAARRT